MANSSLLVRPGPQHGKNVDILNFLREGRAGFAPLLIWSQVVQHSDYSDADTSQSLVLNTAFTSNKFPAHVMVVTALLEHIEGFNSAGNATMILGDAADDNELFTSTSVKTVSANWLQAVGAAQANGPRYEAAYEPLLQLDTTTTNVADLTAGKVRVVIFYYPVGASWGTV